MLYISSFEIFAVTVKNEYEKKTGANFYEDFGHQALPSLKISYESSASLDDTVKKFINKNIMLSRCACECGSVFQNQAC